MKKVIYNSGKGAYESPCCEILSVQAEGVLCQSFGEANTAGVTINENTDYEYDL